MNQYGSEVIILPLATIGVSLSDTHALVSSISEFLRVVTLKDHYYSVTQVFYEENWKTVISCSHIPVNLTYGQKLTSMDDLLKGRKENILKLDYEVVHWATCSNLEVWIENDYNPDLLDSRISIPLLKHLVRVDDKTMWSLYRIISERWIHGSKKSRMALLATKINHPFIKFLYAQGFAIRKHLLPVFPAVELNICKFLYHQEQDKKNVLRLFFDKKLMSSLHKELGKKSLQNFLILTQGLSVNENGDMNDESQDLVIRVRKKMQEG